MVEYQEHCAKLPVEIGQQIHSLTNKTIWDVHYGTSKVNSDNVLVFVFNFANKSDDEVT
jgi:hypothetical protein